MESSSSYNSKKRVIEGQRLVIAVNLPYNTRWLEFNIWIEEEVRSKAGKNSELKKRSESSTVRRCIRVLSNFVRHRYNSVPPATEARNVERNVTVGLHQKKHVKNACAQR